MVFFTCMHCGEALKKPRVEKHFQFQCRRSVSVSCMDCFKDFQGEEYIAHTKCITEAQRYGGKDFVQKPSKNKGERKQQDWILIVQSVIENSKNLSDTERSVLNTLSNHENVPRKKAKFFNFMKSAFPGRATGTVVENIWAKLEEALKKSSENKVTIGDSDVKVEKTSSQTDVLENQNNENLSKEYSRAGPGGKENGKPKDDDACEVSAKSTILADGTLGKSKKSKKRKLVEEVKSVKEQNLNSGETTDKKSEGKDCLVGIEQNGVPSKKSKKHKTKNELENSNGVAENCDDGKSITDNNETSITKFNWSDAILKIVGSKEEISLKKLKKKILAEYRTCSDKTTEEKAVAKFDKKINKMSEIVVTNGKVKLAT